MSLGNRVYICMRAKLRTYTTTSKYSKVRKKCFFSHTISNGNRTEWSTIQGVIGRVISNRPSAQREADLKLRARLPLNCTTRSPITNCLNNKMHETLFKEYLLQFIAIFILFIVNFVHLCSLCSCSWGNLLTFFPWF